MIKSNLAVVLAERNIKITKVSHDTGISRTTLTALTQNNCKGIQFDTLNTLCTYLHVTPSEIIQYYPIDMGNVTFDLDFSEDLDLTGGGQVYICLYYKGVSIDCTFDAVVYCNTINIDNGETTYPYYEMTISYESIKNKLFHEVFNSVSQSVRTYIEDKIAEAMYQTLHLAGSSPEHIEYTIHWNVDGKIFNINN